MSLLLQAAATAGPKTFTVDRLVATAAALSALAGAVLGVLALRRRIGRRGTTVAMVAGAAGAIAGILVLATADGGPGTGNGVVGGFAAVVAGLLAVVLGALARRAAFTSN